MISPPLQFERVRVIYKYALDRIPKHQAQELFKYYTMFEKKFGDRRGIEDVIVSKRRFQYEEEVKVFRGSKTVCDQWVLNITSCFHHCHYFVPIRQTHTTMMPGLITFVWWRMTQTQTQWERFMREPSPTCPPSRRRDTGNDTSTCGSTTLCTKSWRSRSVQFTFRLHRQQQPSF